MADAPAVQIGPKRCLQDLTAGLVLLCGGRVQANPSGYLCSDGLSAAASELIREARAAVRAIELLAVECAGADVPP